MKTLNMQQHNILHTTNTFRQGSADGLNFQRKLLNCAAHNKISAVPYYPELLASPLLTCILASGSPIFSASLSRANTSG